ncbi:MAG: hypothetical protein NVS3B10_31060 [Polyangiales bacterium]
MPKRPAAAADPMNASVRRSCEKLEETLAGSPAFQRVDKNFYVVRQGSAYVYILIAEWGIDRALVRFVAQLVRGVELKGDLAAKLLRLNARMRFGAFGFVKDDSCITFSHTLLGGETLDKDHILATLRDVALVADEYDDKIIAECGGQTMQQILEETALNSLKDHLEHRGWGEA